MSDVNQDNELRKSYYSIIPANVRYDKDLIANAKLLYGEITALCNERGFCWASNQYFAKLYSVSKVTISNWIKQLVDRGYICTELIYREGTKEIINRYIRIVNDPIKVFFNTPIKENFKDNNTVYNNTFNNTSNNNIDTSKKKKHKFGEYKHVLLSDEEYSKLKTELNEKFTKECIKYLDEYMEMNGKSYKSCYLAIRKWVIDAVKKEASKGAIGNKSNNQSQKGYFNNYDQRDYDYDDLEKRLLGWEQ